MKLLIPLALCLVPLLLSRSRRVFTSRRTFLGLFIWPFLMASLGLLGTYPTFYGLGFLIDGLSLTMAVVVALLSLIIMQYSIRYMAEDPKRDPFQKNLGAIVSSVLLMIFSPNLLQFFLAWLATSFILHRLLTHFPDRSRATMAARKKFWISRLGDFLLLTATVLIFISLRTIEFEKIISAANDGILFQLGIVILCLGALTKSAQYPFHSWLPDTMDAPTPVSALMHAGVINSGGYLILRLSPVLANLPVALTLLLVSGVVTAVYASVLMSVQSSVKRSLAYSTISQMGFMMLQCGLGAFHLALVHLVGHAFYKAYGFLSSGTASEAVQVQRRFTKEFAPLSLWTPVLSAIGFILLSVGLLLYSTGGMLESYSGLFIYLIVSLAMSQAVVSSTTLRKSLFAISLCVPVYLLLSRAALHVLPEITVTHQNQLGVHFLGSLFAVMLFFGAYLIQNNLFWMSSTTLGRKLYVKALQRS